ncbi:hypothetical protein [Aquibacillus saliphilus]|uniref:hypothetical protein n=1 Tax=Aquibacillus saliphilus TaxID=1909422 RepID=UPI001CEFBA6A|nr:hypothetical protein [Aquibacillus saliphilus]
MNIVYSQPFFIVNREISNNQQFYFESEKYINLYIDRITTPMHQFYLDEVLDVSYKLLTSSNYCLLYLHTNQGVFTFNVKSSPDELKREFLKTKKSNQH